VDINCNHTSKVKTSGIILLDFAAPTIIGMIDFITTCLILGLITLISVWFVNIQRNRTNLPPGPRPLPFVGNLFMLARGDALRTLRETRTKYGDLFTLRLGSHNAIFVNGYDTIRELLVKRGHETSERPNNFIFDEVLGGKGESTRHNIKNDIIYRDNILRVKQSN